MGINVNVNTDAGTKVYAASVARLVPENFKNREAASSPKKDQVDISQQGRLAAAFDIDEEAAAKMENALKNADIPALMAAAKERQGTLPVNWDRVVDPDGTIYSRTYVESLLRQYQCAENRVRAYYAQEHQKNLAQPTITDGLNYISMKYTDLGRELGSPHYRSDLPKAQREMALRQERALLLGGNVSIGDPYALASYGGMINIRDADRIAWQAARDKIDELIYEYRNKK